MKIVTQYMEKYHARKRPVTTEEAAQIVATASVIYAVEQGEIIIPSYDNQRRLVVTMRFEQIVK